MKKIELLSPAGDMDALDRALQYGADAVYLAGKSFGMRSGAGNFTAPELAVAVEKAHTLGKKVYVTCNTIVRGYELAELEKALALYRDLNVDALIVADLGVMAMAKRIAPNVELHVSTQTGVANAETANVLYQMGASRVVLARELTLDEITQIRANTPPELEIEAFVHGSMCVSFSGRCLLSNYLTGRDANRGACAQPCRWKYHLVEETRPGEYMPFYEEDGGAYILNSRDLCMIEHIPELVKAGVYSFKIEGRAKTSYYSAVVTNAYRVCIDEYLKDPESYSPPKWALEEVNKVSHRQYATGFYFGGEPGQVYENGGYIREYEVAAIVLGCENGILKVSQRNKFSVGETLELFAPGKKPIEFTLTSMTDEAGEAIESAPHPVMTVNIPFKGEVHPAAMLRKKKNQ